MIAQTSDAQPAVRIPVISFFISHLHLERLPDSRLLSHCLSQISLVIRYSALEPHHQSTQWSASRITVERDFDFVAYLTGGVYREWQEH
jgi:hypothetical protein